MLNVYEKLNCLKSQKEAGDKFNFKGAVYTIIPRNGGKPIFVQPLNKKTLTNDLVEALKRTNELQDMVIEGLSKY